MVNSLSENFVRASFGVVVLFSAALILNAKKNGNENHRRYLEMARADRVFLERSLREETLSVCKVADEVAKVRLSQVQQQIDGSGEITAGDRRLYVRVGATIARVSVVHGYNTQTDLIEVRMPDCR